jgi:predicted GNAT superfamily acetyltransferase
VGGRLDDDTLGIDDAETVAVRELHDPAEHQALAALVGEVWPVGPGTSVHGSDIYTAFAHNGGYVAGAFLADELVGGAVGFLATGARLHSHVACVRPGLEHRGIGFTVKQHQRAWAREHGLSAITWTFDPLVRRNGYFNLTKLGARIVEYAACFYGVLDDGVNAGDETDRAIVEWRVEEVPSGRVACDAAESCRVATPEDIVALRRVQPSAAAAWRTRLRHELGDRIHDGWIATNMSRDGFYTLVRP